MEEIIRKAPIDWEVCGFLLGFFQGSLARVTGYREVRNISTKPHEFLMDPRGVLEAYEEARSRGLDLVGIYHTHPRSPGIPSNRDLEGMELWPIPWLIIEMPGGGMRAWILCGSLRVLRELRISVTT